MKNIFRQAAVILIFLGGWYLFSLFLSYHFYPGHVAVDNSNTEPSSKIKNSIFLSDSADDLFGFWGIKSGPKRMIILGASNAQEGILPSVLHQQLPDFTVYNASVGGSNTTQIRQIVDVIRMSNPGSLKGTIFILGVFFGTFVNDDSQVGHVLWQGKNITLLQLEGLRYGFYRPNDKTLELTINPSLMPLTVQLIRPLLFWDIFFFDLRVDYADFWERLHSKKANQVETMTEATKEGAVTNWKKLGNLKDFAEAPEMDDFVSFCRELNQSGASVVVVDLPLPQWLRDRSEYYKKYVIQRNLYLNEIKKIPRIQYLDVDARLANTPDINFLDSSHPSKETAKLWSEQIASFIQAEHNSLGF